MRTAMYLQFNQLVNRITPFQKCGKKSQTYAAQLPKISCFFALVHTLNTTPNANAHATIKPMILASVCPVTAALSVSPSAGPEPSWVQEYSGTRGRHNRQSMSKIRMTILRKWTRAMEKRFSAACLLSAWVLVCALAKMYWGIS